MSAQDPRTLLAELDASVESTDAIMQRAMSALREVIADREQLEAIARQMSVARAASSAVLVEAACALHEQATGRSVFDLDMETRRLAS
ncbi:hypothetical protein ACRQ1B_06220 [Rhizobium panacihumi]|uniref:hypothetical protein n=1 Tax=Rhizobium panacihumi TaxID=2008450 RepID=UPI003D78E259